MYCSEMKVLLFVLFALASCTKERFEDAASLTDELLHELEKRLNNLHKDFGSSEELLDDVKILETKNTIIKTSESLEAGAVYLGSPELTTEHLCQNECRKNWTCNLAVFKEKDGDTSCYLFNCQKPSVCSFVEHDGFSISELAERDTTRKAGSSEDDLELLAAVKPKTTTETSTVSTTKPTTTVTSTTVQTEPPRREPGPLFSECTDHKDCAPSSTQCLAGYCVCQDSYHPQEGQCRPDCTKFQFECANEGQPLGYTQCIAIYDKCDGIKHCHDGSDEENCVKESIPDSPTAQEPNRPYVENKDTQKFGHDNAPGFMDHRPIHPTDSHEKPDRNDDKSTEHPQYSDQHMKSQATNPQKVVAPDLGDGASSKQQSSEEKSEESQLSSDEDSKYSNNENIENHKETVLVPSSPKPAEPGSDDAAAENDDNDEKGDLPKETLEVIEMEDGSVVGVAVDESGGGDTGVAVVVQTNKGAVVALSLGLVITFLLLSFVGCRLRNVRKRLRRGRPMNSNEADYLINGMYL